MVQWLRPHTSKAGFPGFEPWPGNKIPHAKIKSSHVTAKDHRCLNKDWRSHVPQLKPNTAKLQKKKKKMMMFSQICGEKEESNTYKFQNNLWCLEVRVVGEGVITGRRLRGMMVIWRGVLVILCSWTGCVYFGKNSSDCTRIFTAALTIMAKREQSKCPPVSFCNMGKYL